MRDGVGVGVGDARLNQMKARDALLVEHRDFAIENGLLRGDLVRHDGQLGILALAVQAAARSEADLLVVEEGDGADAVPFDFEEPIVAARRMLGRASPSWARWRRAWELCGRL